MIFEIISGGEKTDWVGKEWAGLFFPKTDWGEIPACYTGQKYCRMLPGARTVEIPCPTCPTWSQFIQDKLKISIYLYLDKYKFMFKVNTVLYFIF